MQLPMNATAHPKVVGTLHSNEDGRCCQRERIDGASCQPDELSEID